jgi:hypothetical protein
MVLHEVEFIHKLVSNTGMVSRCTWSNEALPGPELPGHRVGSCSLALVGAPKW